MSVNCSNPMLRQRGFTLIELVTIVVILAILAVVALPRMGNTEYETREFRDKVVSALRYAQKSAVSHRRRVCVNFTASSVSLTMDTANAGACGTPLNLPASSTHILNSPDASTAFFSAGSLAVLNFESDGRSTGRSLSIPGEADIVVVGATGHVN
jgi:MSHA pilin protein MshC